MTEVPAAERSKPVHKASWLAIAVLAVISGCILSDDDAPAGVAAYFPLDVGTVWRYALTSECVEARHVGMVVTVTDTAGEWARVEGRWLDLVWPARQSVEYHSVGERGLVRRWAPDDTTGETILIGAPLAVGTRWKRMCGSNAEITHTDTAIVTQAGRFANVVAVRASAGYCDIPPHDVPELATVWYYAPNVGLVKEEIIDVESSTPCDERGATVQLAKELVRYTPG